MLAALLILIGSPASGGGRKCGALHRGESQLMLDAPVGYERNGSRWGHDRDLDG